MAERVEFFHFLKEIFPQAGPDLLRLLQGAAENTLLMRSDFYTIRDWLEIAGLDGDEPATAVLLLLMVALEEGSLCIAISEHALERRLRDVAPDADVMAWGRRIVEAVGSSAYTGLIGATPDDDRPVISHTVSGEQFLYFQKYLRAELDFQCDLKARLDQATVPSAVNWPRIMREVINTQPLRLDPDQHRALESSLTNNLTIISGGPGTGKTSIVLTLLRCLVRGGIAPDRVALAAPTGRAAQRLTDSLRAGLGLLNADVTSLDAALRGVTASTLHHLLDYSPTRHAFRRHRENPIAADFVIVDEVSMVGLVLMAQLLQALLPTTKLVLLGDKDQLPSVEAGAVLAHLVPSESEMHARAPRVVLLRTNHRSQPAIRAAADAVNRQDIDFVDRLPALTLSSDTELDGQTGCCLLEQSLGTTGEVRGFLQHWAERAYFRSRARGRTLAQWIDAIEYTSDNDLHVPEVFALMDRFRLLTLVRESAWGCDDINAFLKQYLQPRFDTSARSGLFAGAPVLITRNDASRGLYNGDVGLTLRARNGGLRVAFPRPGGAASFPAESLPAHELGFALTVHKSQGSEYDNVMLVVPPKGGKRLLTKELIYTAITRAKSFAIICASKEVLKLAVGRRIVRESGVLRFSD